MKNVTIPLNPFPFPVLKRLSSKFQGIGYNISKGYPHLELELEQAEIPLHAKEFGAMVFVITVFYFIAFSLIAFLVAFRFAPDLALLAAPIIGVIFSFLIFIQLTFYPKIQVKKKIRSIDTNLVFALRTILVEIKSSVTLFDSMNIIATGNYGEISKAFKKTIEKISTGTIEEDALDEMATNNPSLYFRRAIWQLVNGLKLLFVFQFFSQ